MRINYEENANLMLLAYPDKDANEVFIDGATPPVDEDDDD